jgi:hypothetical protein
LQGSENGRVVTIAAFWKREPISDDYLPSMRKAVLSISGNVFKQQET